MKNIHILFVLILLSVITSCTDKFEDFNTDKKNPAIVSGESLFSSAQKELCDQISSTNVNQNVWKLWSQQWTETTYTDEANYDVVTRNIPDNTFRYYYRESLKDLDEASKIINATAAPFGEDPAIKQNKLQIIELLKAYTFQQLVDIFGMVPYTEALDINNVYPKYEDGYTIYKDLLTKVNAAISGMEASSESFGAADLYYAGDVSKWIKFGNSLKIKIGITMADADNALAKTAIESGVLGCFSSSDDDCLLAYLQASPNFNPLYADIVASGRDDFVPANTLVDKMNALDDPRMAFYFTKTDTSTNSGVVKLAYLGGEYGYSSPFSQYSHIAPEITKPNFKGILFTYSEIQFYLAEAAARGYLVPKTAAAYYSDGIRASFAFWGADNVETYLAKPEVAYATATGTWQQKIATQSWIASYTRGLEAYTTWRRLDFPIFNIAENITTYSEIPLRFTFPINEQTLNGTNYKAAAIAVGGDELTTKIFWDKH